MAILSMVILFEAANSRRFPVVLYVVASQRERTEVVGGTVRQVEPLA